MEIILENPALPELSSRARLLAGLQQLKDTLTIVSMNIMLLFGLLFFGLPIPGLVLYCVRWRLLRRTASQSSATQIWLYTLLHEVLCVLLFASDDMHQEMQGMATYLSWGYALGAAISLLALIDVTTHKTSQS